MFKLNQKGVAHLLVPIILLIGLVVGVYLVTSGNPLKFIPKASVSKPVGPETSLTLVGPNGCSGWVCPLNAILNINPQSEFEIKLYARSDIEGANIFEARMNFPTELVEVKEIKTEGSFITNWIENYYDSSTGTGEIALTGGVISPGYQTQQGQPGGLMATIVLQAKQIGTGTITFNPDSAIYSNLNNINILTIARNYDISIEDTPSETPRPDSSAMISVKPSTVTSGDYLTVSWNIPNASVDDYIRILTLDESKNAGPNGISPSNNCNLNNIPGKKVITAGECSINSATVREPGTFKLGYYDYAGNLRATSSNFTVNAASTGTLSASPIEATTHSQVNLVWKGISNAHPKDFINYLNVDNYTGTAAGHTYWPSNNCAWFTDSTIPAVSGSCGIEAPIYATGNFKLVLYSGKTIDGLSPILAVSNVIKVNPRSGNKGDGNKDGKINLIDMSILHTDWNIDKDTQKKIREGIDMNDDGLINTNDFAALRQLLQNLKVIKVK